MMMRDFVNSTLVLTLLVLVSGISGRGINESDSLSSKGHVAEYLLQSGIDLEKVKDSALFVGTFCCLYDLNEKNLGWRFPSIRLQMENRNFQDSIVSSYMDEIDKYRKRASKDVLVGVGILVIGATALRIANATLLEKSSGDLAFSINTPAVTILLGSYVFKAFQGAKNSGKAFAHLKMAVTRSNARYFSRCCPSQ